MVDQDAENNTNAHLLPIDTFTRHIDARLDRQDARLEQIGLNTSDRFLELMTTLHSSSEFQSSEGTRLTQDLKNDHRTILAQIESSVCALDRLARGSQTALLKLTDYETNLNRVLTGLDRTVWQATSLEHSAADRGMASISIPTTLGSSLSNGFKQNHTLYDRKLLESSLLADWSASNLVKI